MVWSDDPLERPVTTPAVLLHAFPFGPDLWSPVVRDLGSDPSWRHRVHVPALPGFAGTPLPGAPPDLAVVAEHIIDMLAAAEHGAPVILGGVSLGGYVAMAVAGQRPDLLAGLLLIDTKATTDAEAARKGRLAMAERAEREPSAIGELLVQQLMPKLLGSTTRSDRPGVVANVSAWLRQAPPDAVAWYQRAMAQRSNSLDLLAALDCPTLVLYGDEDELSPSAEQDQMVAVLRAGHRQVVKGVGHLAVVEDPPAVARAIRAFVKRPS